MGTTAGHGDRAIWVRRNRRRTSLALVLALLVLAGTTATSTAEEEPTVERQGWAPEATLVTSVPQDGHLYVSARAGAPEARLGVQLRLGADHAGALPQAVLELTEANDSLLSDKAELLLCALGTTPLEGEGQLEEAPTADCRSQAPLARDDDQGTWSAPLDVFVDRWSSPPAGVVVLARPSSPSGTWRVSFEAEATAVRLAAPPFNAEQTVPASTEPPATASTVPTTATTTPTTAIDQSAPTSQPSLPAPEARSDPGRPAPQVLEAPAPVEPVAAADSRPRPHADHPAAAVVLALVALVLAAGFALARYRHMTATALDRPGGKGSADVSATLAKATFVALALIAPLAAGEVTLFRIGLILITMIGAMGLHVLVNWAGELSLAHAGLIGLPAFTVAKLSGDQEWSPLLLLPVAVLAGATVGGIVGLPALRSRGLQVALVTLAAGLAIERFFFTKPWLVGAAGGVNVAEPTLGPFSFTTTRSLYPLLAIAFLISVGAMWALHRSKVARAWLWIRDDPAAASVFGVPVSGYRVLAYAVAGALAGFAGGLTGIWVQRLTPQTFPYSLSFIYLVIVVVGGRGFVGGVLAAAALLEGGRLFFSGADVLVDYGGPIALILVLTRYRTGLNGIWRHAMSTIPNLSDRPRRERSETTAATPYTVQFCVGIGCVVLGFVAIALAWYHSGNTDQVWIQNQELISGGVGGTAAVLLGAGLLIRDQIAKGQRQLATRLDNLVAARDLDNAAPRPGTAPDPASAGNGARTRPRRSVQLEASR